LSLKLGERLSSAGESVLHRYGQWRARRASRRQERARTGAKKRSGMVRVFAVLSATFLVLVVGGLLAGVYMIWRLSQDLPDYDHLARYEPPVMTRVHAGDGSLIGEYARERRLYVPIEAIPQPVIDAFLSAEDKNFYAHDGIDARGVMRAVIENIKNVIQGRRLEGASTITQQVAKNFLLSSDVTMERKLKEALLALRIEDAFSKQQILELYLNEIYLGLGSYGVAAAALNYFGKPLDELTIAETAYLAALPKAPNNYHPFRQRERAIARRNWVIGRMEENGVITPYQASEARGEELTVTPRPFGAQLVDANFFVEEVRRELYDRYGENRLYEGGLSVRTTLDPELQSIARDSLRKGLVAYDRRHGWRGPVASMNAGENWHKALAEMSVPGDIAPWTLGAVLSLNEEGAKIGVRPEQLKSGAFEEEPKTGFIPLEEMKWAREHKGVNSLGPEVRKPSDVLSVGDVVFVEKKADSESDYILRQVPEVNGAVVALDPHTGRVLALEGGFSFEMSEFNRAVQAKRQPGSSFKPFVYAAALDNGYTPSSLVLDAPFVMDQGPGLALWKPENYSNRFYGPSTLRLGIEKSRNVMTVRLAQNIGMEKVADYAERFGVMHNMPPVLSMALGAGETTLLDMTTAYAMFVNGGKRIEPTTIDRIQDRWGRTIYRHDERVCEDCAGIEWNGQQPPELPDLRAQVISPQTAYQVVSMLEGVVQRGTGGTVARVGVPLAGKTGTTNDERDAWFVGFSPNLAVGVFVGFDEPKPMGRGETGGGVAAPIFRDFMMEAVGDEPAIPFRIPPGVNLVRVNAQTGELAQPGDERVILEAFKEGTEPRGTNDNGGGLRGPADGLYGEPAPNVSLGSGTGGLY